MALILNLETATSVCSVVLAENGKQLSMREEVNGQQHASLLITFITDCLREAGKKLTQVDAIAVSSGPGSFTGLRIGVATAKGLCYSLDKPLISVNTLQSMACKIVLDTKVPSGTLLCPMIDARRMEVYTAFMNQEFDIVFPIRAEVIVAGIFDEILNQHPVIFFGDGMEKTREILDNHHNAILFPNFQVGATGMIPFSEKSYKSAHFESTAYFEPFYLKDFFTGRQPLKS